MKTTTRQLLLAGIALLIGLPGMVVAQSSSDAEVVEGAKKWDIGPVLVGDPVAGKEKSVVCAGCHGADGQAIGVYNPNLAGQQEIYIVVQLQNFRSGKRISEMMLPMSKILNDQEIANLAAYYAGLK